MKEIKMKHPYEKPEVKAISLKTEDILGESATGGFFGEDDSFMQNKAIQIFE